MAGHNYLPNVPKHIFIHFLDHEIYHAYGLDKRERGKVLQEFQLAFRIAFLLAEDGLILPASHFFESEICRMILARHEILAEFGYINVAANTLDPAEFLQKKQAQYQINRDRYPKYFEITTIRDLESRARWIVKSRDSTTDISEDWARSIEISNNWKDLYKFSNTSNVSKFENEIAAVPIRLDSNAFIADFVTGLLPIKDGIEQLVSKLVNTTIQRSYIDSFLKTYDAACIGDLLLFDTSVLLPTDKVYFSFAKAKRFLWMNGILTRIETISPPELLQLKLSDFWNVLVTDLRQSCQSISDKSHDTNNELPSEGDITDHRLFAGSRKAGRPSFSDDLWAWEEVNIEHRSPKDVYLEWLEKPNVISRQLQDPVRQFRRITKADWRKSGKTKSR